MSKLRDEMQPELEKRGLQEIFRIDSYNPGPRMFCLQTFKGRKLSPYLPAKQFKAYMDGYFKAFDIHHVEVKELADAAQALYNDASDRGECSDKGSEELYDDWSALVSALKKVRQHIATMEAFKTV